jgi:hypothetical protein
MYLKRNFFDFGTSMKTKESSLIMACRIGRKVLVQVRLFKIFYEVETVNFNLLENIII